MFTIEMVREAHSKVKTGADFPAYIQDIKKIGVLSYEHFVNDGHINYQGRSGFVLPAPAKWPTVPVAPRAKKDDLQHAIKIQQQGITDYPTFCRQAAEAGVEKWIVDTQRMMCTYYDLSGHEMVAEPIPDAKVYSH